MKVKRSAACRRHLAKKNVNENVLPTKNKHAYSPSIPDENRRRFNFSCSSNLSSLWTHYEQRCISFVNASSLWTHRFGRMHRIHQRSVYKDHGSDKRHSSCIDRFSVSRTWQHRLSGSNRRDRISTGKKKHSSRNQASTWSLKQLVYFVYLYKWYSETPV